MQICENSNANESAYGRRTVIKIVPLFLSEDIGRYNIGSIRCDEKAYFPETETAPTQFFASAPFPYLYLYESHYMSKSAKLVPATVLKDCLSIGTGIC